MESLIRSGFELAKKLAPPILLVLVGAGLMIGGITVVRENLAGGVANVVVILSVTTGALSLLVGLASFLRPSGLADYGMIGIWRPRDSRDFQKRLGAAKSLTVLKTWFPEDEYIQKGLEEALTKNHADVKLLLCAPNSDVLGIRAHSARATLQDASDWIVKGLQIVAEHTAPDSFRGVGFYKTWPGCPVIWTEDRIYMGFYFSGQSSPNFPWIEVKPNSDLGVQLKSQKRILWKQAERLETVEKLRAWLEKHTAPSGGYRP